MSVFVAFVALFIHLQLNLPYAENLWLSHIWFPYLTRYSRDPAISWVVFGDLVFWSFARNFDRSYIVSQVASDSYRIGVTNVVILSSPLAEIQNRHPEQSPPFAAVRSAPWWLTFGKFLKDKRRVCQGILFLTLQNCWTLEFPHRGVCFIFSANNKRNPKYGTQKTTGQCSAFSYLYFNHSHISTALLKIWKIARCPLVEYPTLQARHQVGPLKWQTCPRESHFEVAKDLVRGRVCTNGC